MHSTLPRLVSWTSSRLSLLSSPFASTSTSATAACSTNTLPVTSRTLAPLRYHLFSEPIPYMIGLEMQNDIVQARRRAKSVDPVKSRGVGDIVLLLEHTPTYTTGRRDNSPNPNTLHPEEKKVQNVGAEFHITKRGGQVTYHGPGQLVGYPVLDLNVMETPTRCYVEYLQSLLAEYVRDDLSLSGILAPHPEGHVGVFSSPTEKVASIGIHLSHRITSHGFAMNITPEPVGWFDLVTACGLNDVRATCVHQLLQRQRGGTITTAETATATSSSSSSSLQSQAVLPSVAQAAMSIVPKFGQVMGRSILPLFEERQRSATNVNTRDTTKQAGQAEQAGEAGQEELEEIRRLILSAERRAKEENARKGGWRTEPDLSRSGV